MGIGWFGGVWKIGYTVYMGIPCPWNGNLMRKMMIHQWMQFYHMFRHTSCTGLLEFHVMWKSESRDSHLHSGEKNHGKSSSQAPTDLLKLAAPFKLDRLGQSSESQVAETYLYPERVGYTPRNWADPTLFITGLFEPLTSWGWTTK